MYNVRFFFFFVNRHSLTRPLHLLFALLFIIFSCSPCLLLQWAECKNMWVDMVLAEHRCVWYSDNGSAIIRSVRRFTWNQLIKLARRWGAWLQIESKWIEQMNAYSLARLMYVRKYFSRMEQNRDIRYIWFDAVNLKLCFWMTVIYR